MSPKEFRNAQSAEPHPDAAPVISPQDSRQAVPLGHVRYVLAISVGAAAIAGVIIWLSFFA